MMDTFVYYLASFLAVIVILTLHEFSHAFAATRCGDMTPKWAGRLTLNPLKHFDILGLIMFTIVGFGWAKPVPINPSNFKHYKSGLFWTAIAGVLTNYITAFVWYPISFFVIMSADPLMGRPIYTLIVNFVNFLYVYSLSFCIFNLLPLYPLDGFRVVEALNKRHGKVFQFLQRYGYYILLALILESYLCDIFSLYAFDILGYIMSAASFLLGTPISLFWNWFLGLFV